MLLALARCPTARGGSTSTPCQRPSLRFPTEHISHKVIKPPVTCHMSHGTSGNALCFTVRCTIGKTQHVRGHTGGVKAQHRHFTIQYYGTVLHGMMW